MPDAARPTILCVASYFKGERFLERAKQEGARLLCGGRQRRLIGGHAGSRWRSGLRRRRRASRADAINCAPQALDRGARQIVGVPLLRSGRQCSVMLSSCTAQDSNRRPST